MNKSAIQGLAYDDISILFRAAGLPHSRSAVTRTLRGNAKLCPPERYTYKTVRFDPDKVQAVIDRIFAVRRGEQLAQVRKLGNGHTNGKGRR